MYKMGYLSILKNNLKQCFPKMEILERFQRNINVINVYQRNDPNNRKLFKNDCYTTVRS